MGSSRQDAHADLFLGPQVFEETMNQSMDIALGQREGVVVHGLLPDGAVDQVLRRPLDEIEDNGSLAEANVLVANRRRSPAPRLPAAKRSANHTRIASISGGNGHVTVFHREMIVH